MQCKGVLMIWFLLGVVLVAHSQKRTKPVAPAKKITKHVPVKASVAATYFIKNRSVKLRWAPANEESWRYGNKHGYVLERRTIVRDEKLLSSAEQIKSFQSFGFMTDSVSYWEKLITVNDNAAVMAQALYGESFELDINSAGGVGKGSSMLSKSQENKQRYLFAMYAADNDFAVAEKAGLAYTDTAVKPNEKYFYRLYAAGNKQQVQSDSALLFVSFQDIPQLPQTADIIVEPSNKSIVLSWDMSRTKSYYGAFIIQRSVDSGKTFLNLNQRPYTSFGQGNDPRLPNSIVYIDTTVEVGVNYRYRVKGITIFGELGPPSATVEGKTLPLLEGVPGIQGIHLNTKGQPILNWYFEDSVRSKITGFELTQAPSEGGEYKKIISNIDPLATEVRLPDTLSPGYLVIKAVSKEGLSRTSFPYLFQPEDSLPPRSPIGVTATVDSVGRVALTWLPNTEKDLLGYKVFRTMVKGTEPAVLVDTVWTTNVFIDTLDLKLKNRKVYYTVSALDYRFNQSAKCKEIEVVKPDIIPPTSPVFADYQLKEGTVEINWVNPTDEDLAGIVLQRKAAAVGEWKTIFQTTKKEIVTYADKDIEADKKYSYQLAAVDEAGLRSPDAQVLTIQALPLVIPKVFKTIEADLNREKRLIYLRWETVGKAAIKSIEIFKGSDKEPLTLYKIIDGKVLELLDNDLLVNTKYKYGIRAVLANGQYSELMIKEINY